jgi:hypothetical protein
MLGYKAEVYKATLSSIESQNVGGRLSWPDTAKRRRSSVLDHEASSTKLVVALHEGPLSVGCAEIFDRQ